MTLWTGGDRRPPKTMWQRDTGRVLPNHLSFCPTNTPAGGRQRPLHTQTLIDPESSCLWSPRPWPSPC